MQRREATKDKKMNTVKHLTAITIVFLGLAVCGAAVADDTAAQDIGQEAGEKDYGALLRKAREREAEAKKLAKEAAQYSKRADLAESKMHLAMEQLAAKQARIDSLQKSLDSFEREKAELTPLSEKFLEVLIIILSSMAVFFAVKFGIKFFLKAIMRKVSRVDREVTLRIKTFVKIFDWMAAVFIFLTMVFLILEAFGISVAPLIAGAGIIGIAVGFGSQYLVRDVISGFFLLMEGQYRIDDVVKIGDYSGLVEDINLRITTLRDMEGRVIIIPNGEIKAVINYTKEYAQALFDLRVAYKEDLDKVMETIKDLGKEMRSDKYYGALILDELEMFGVDDFTDSAAIVKFRIKTLPVRQWDVAREFRRRLKNRFDKLGIRMPFPHRTLYWGEPENTPQR